MLFALIVGTAALVGVPDSISGPGDVSNLARAVVGDGVFPAVVEDILFCAILFRFVEEFAGSGVAILISSALFGLSHLENPNADMLSTVGIMFEGGILLAAAYLLTRRLWLSMGLHASWKPNLGRAFRHTHLGNDGARAGRGPSPWASPPDGWRFRTGSVADLDHHRNDLRLVVALARSSERTCNAAVVGAATDGVFCLEEAVRVDVDADPDLGAPLDPPRASRGSRPGHRGCGGRGPAGAGDGGRGAWQAGQGRGRTPPCLRLSGAAWPMRRATASASLVSAETTIAARRPKGGIAASRRASVSAA